MLLMFVALCVGLAVLLRGRVDWTSLLSTLRQARPGHLAGMLLLQLLAMLLRAWRLHVVLRTGRSFLRTWHISNFGNFANIVLPLRAGELGMAALLAKDLTGGGALARLFVDRLLDVLTAAVFAFVALWLLVPAAQAGHLDALAGAAVGLGLCLGAIFLVTRFEEPLVELARAVARLLRREPAPFAGLVRAGVEGLRSLFRMGIFVPAMAFSLSAWLALVGAYMLGMGALFPPPPVAAAILAMCLALLGLVLMPLPAGVGTTHGAIIVALTMFGVPAGEALAFAVMIHASSVLVIALFGMWSTRCLGVDLGGKSLGVGAGSRTDSRP